MFQRIIDRQYRRPRGLLGRYIGERMGRDHRPENLWTISVMQARPTDHVLEVGFGAGFAIQALSRIVSQGRIAGVDASKTMVRVAQKRNSQSVAQGLVDLRLGLAAHLPFEDDSFDQVFSIHSIYFWPRPRLALKQIYRVLKPGGTVTLTVLPKSRWNADKPTAPLGTPNCRPYSGEELAQLLTAAGFSWIAIRSDPDPAHRANYCVIGTK